VELLTGGMISVQGDDLLVGQFQCRTPDMRFLTG